MKIGFIGAIVVVAILTLHAIEHWTVIDSIVTQLRSAGPVGDFLVKILMSPLLPLALAVAAIYSVFEGRKEQKDLSSSPATTTDNSASQTQTTGAVTQQVFVGGRPPELQDESSEKQTEEIPVVSYVQVRNVRLCETAYAIWDDIGGGPPTGIVAQFKNISKGVGQRTPRASSVTANLVFRNPEHFDEQEIHISHGTWLRRYEHFVTFNAGDTHDLVVAVRGASFISLENPNASNPFRGRSRYSRVINHARQIVLPWEHGELAITLVDFRGVTVFNGVFDYEFSQEAMIVTSRRIS